MPQPVVLEQLPVRLSIVEFNPALGEEIFLTYTRDRRNGPRIVRTRVGPPSMLRVRPRVPGEVTTHPVGQRLGSWLIQDDLRQADRAAAQNERANLQRELTATQAALRAGTPWTGRSIEAIQADIDLLTEYINENRTIPAHDREFATVYPNHEIIGQQGCGDLTMNLWCVAFVNSPLAAPTPDLIFLYEEPVASRTYSCLIKWQPGKGPGGSASPEYSIEDVRFNPLGQGPNDMVFTWDGNRWQPRGNGIEFAVYGKQVVRRIDDQGTLVDVRRITQELSDLRHLVQMPNLNPNAPLFDGAPGRPRFYFGRLQRDDVWFGEAALLDDVNLQRLAVSDAPIFLSRLYRGLGASREQIVGAMQREGYREIKDARQLLNSGEFRFVPEDDTLVEVYLKRNTYGWSMIGLSAKRDRILWLACDGVPGQMIGHVLEDAARQLIAVGASDVLLMDEGGDVFQKVLLGHNLPKAKVYGGGPELDITVPLKRTRLRATFIAARPRTNAGGKGGDLRIDMNPSGEGREHSDG